MSKTYVITPCFKEERGASVEVRVPDDYPTLESACRALVEAVDEGDMDTRVLDDSCGPTFIGYVAEVRGPEHREVGIPATYAEPDPGSDLRDALDDLLSIFDEEIEMGVGWENDASISGTHGAKIRRARAALARHADARHAGPAWVAFLAECVDAFPRDPDAPINGSDMVDWYVNVMRPKADRLLGRSPEQDGDGVSENDRVQGAAGR